MKSDAGMTTFSRIWPRVVAILLVVAVAVPAAIASYQHAMSVARRAGEHSMAEWLPLSVDGMLLAALIVLWVRRWTGRPGGRGPWLAFWAGMVATVAANLASAEPHLMSYVVAVWPPVALAITLELAISIITPTAPPDPEAVALAEDVERAEAEFGISVTATLVSRLCHVYRLFGEDDILLYVGIGWDVTARLRKHRDRKEWWSEVVEATVTTYPDRLSALDAEVTAIAQERPLYNKLRGKGHDHAVPGRIEDGRYTRTPPVGWTPSDPVSETSRTLVDELTARRQTAADQDGPEAGPRLADESDDQLAERLTIWTQRAGAVPAREQVRVAYGIGSRRAARLREMVVQTPETVDETGSSGQPEAVKPRLLGRG